MMGFQKVFKVLQEIFPTVDSRILRAVAIEHRKDADMAVEVVLTEVIPYLTKNSLSSSSSESNNVGSSSEMSTGKSFEDKSPEVDASIHGGDSVIIDKKGSDEEQNGSSTGLCQSLPTADADAGHNQLLSEANGGHVKFSGACANREAALSENSQETSTLSVSHQAATFTTGTLKDPKDLSTDVNKTHSSSIEASDESVGLDHVPEVNGGGNNSYISLGQVSSTDVDDMPEGSGELIVVADLLNSDSQYSQPSYAVNTALKKDTGCEMIEVDDDSVLGSVVTRSGQICSIDLLEGIIENARSNKKTLFSAMESVISLMKEVVLQEEAAEQARQAAAKGGLDLLNRVQDLKEMLQHAKEANDMHTGEVYGERAILATEVKELQSRLFCLSEERDKSLAVLNEMRQTLLSRLEEAEKEINEAEKEKLDREESARKSLAEEELIMEKVVQEANTLKQEAEENAKLREFLVDRGRLIDMLQGEISVICQDVMHLKEKFDKRIPLSRSLSSSQTSCILASSGSSSRSMTLDKVDQVPGQSESSEDHNNSDAIPDLIVQQNSSDSIPDDHGVLQFSGGPIGKDDHKALEDEGWEIFEDGDYQYV